jgi:hypothetical protein
VCLSEIDRERLPLREFFFDFQSRLTSLYMRKLGEYQGSSLSKGRLHKVTRKSIQMRMSTSGKCHFHREPEKGVRGSKSQKSQEKYPNAGVNIRKVPKMCTSTGNQKKGSVGQSHKSPRKSIQMRVSTSGKYPKCALPQGTRKRGQWVKVTKVPGKVSKCGCQHQESTQNAGPLPGCRKISV